MAKILKIIFLTAIFSFLWGVWWVYKDEFKPLIINEVTKVHILAPSGLISQDLIRIAKDSKIEVNVTELDSSYKMLREILSPQHGYDLILFSSYLTDSILLSNYFADQFSEAIYDRLSVSIDFRSLKFDPENRFTLPFLWSVNLWLHPDNVQDFSLSEAFNSTSKQNIYVQQEPSLLYSLFKKLYPQGHSLIQTHNEEELTNLFRQFTKNISLRKGDLKDHLDKGPIKDYIQLRHTEVSELASGSVSYSLPVEKSDLEILLIAVNKNIENSEPASRMIQFLFSKEAQSELLRANKFATVSYNLKSTNKLQNPDYIRELPISRLDIPSAHEAYEPLFTEFLKSNYPEALKETQ